MGKTYFLKSGMEQLVSTNSTSIQRKLEKLEQ